MSKETKPGSVPLLNKNNADEHSQSEQVSGLFSTITKAATTGDHNTTNSSGNDDLIKSRESSHQSDVKDLSDTVKNASQPCMGHSQNHTNQSGPKEEVYLCQVRKKSEILVQSVIEEALNQTIQVEDRVLKPNGFRVQPNNENSFKFKTPNRPPSSVVPVFDEHGNLIRENCSDSYASDSLKLNFVNGNNLADPAFNTSENSLCKLIRNRPNERSSVKQKRDVS